MDETAELMRRIAGALDWSLNGDVRPKETGFVLLLFPFNGEPGARTNYVSNGKREDILVALKEIVTRFEGQAEISRRA